MHRAGFVAIIGRPNVGKSTLMNALVGQKIAIASPRVQTTRSRIRGILTIPQRGQIVFLDTPGVLKPKDKLGEHLVSEAEKSLEEANAFLFVVDASMPPGPGDQWLAEHLIKTGKYLLFLINKIDQVKDPELRKKRREEYLRLLESYQNWDYLTISALTGKRLQEIPKLLIKHLPEAELIYSADELTDQHMRSIAQEMIREKAMQFTEEELPHSIAVLIDRFDESDPACIRIYATLFVDQKSQKGMVIGKQGQMIKKIGQAARKEIESMLEAPVYLDLNVKVKENWRKDSQFLRSLGLG